MEILTLFTTAFFVGFTGAAMPGPMLSVTMDRTARFGWIAGPLVVLGHGTLELILVIAIAFGFTQILTAPVFTSLVGILGGAFLVWMGIGVVRDAGQVALPGETSNDAVIKTTPAGKGRLSSIGYGITTSLSNPYWFLWWGTVGAGYVSLALNSHGIAGLAAFFSGHILADFTWFTAVSLGLARGGRHFSPRVFAGLLRVLGIFLILFSFYFIISGFKMLPI